MDIQIEHSDRMLYSWRSAASYNSPLLFSCTK